MAGIERVSKYCNSFNSLPWHDSKLYSMSIRRSGNGDEVVLRIELASPSGDEGSSAELIFENVAFLFCDVDVQGKRQASDDISEAKCMEESELKKKIQSERLKFSPDALKNYLHFNFYLVPPFGSIDILAQSFRLIRLDAGQRGQPTAGGDR